ncbi:MAG TPA: hypothetical protein VFN59_01925 [Acidimicrobiales bacterium]|nr:hypothetical protein [Acidimicrobiales bacterium]
MPARVYLEEGRTWVFAVALDWPGWCRRGRGRDAALAALLEYRDRYRAVPSIAFRPGPLEVVGVVAGTSTTDFGAPDAVWPQDRQLPSRAERRRHIERLQDCWRYFDDVVSRAPARLRTGPRGGGRHRDAIYEHVREAERAYASRVGRPIPPRTPWADQRATLAAALTRDEPGARWPAAYALRRIAWHVLDHAFEIEDRAS